MLRSLFSVLLICFGSTVPANTAVAADPPRLPEGTWRVLAYDRYSTEVFQVKIKLDTSELGDPRAKVLESRIGQVISTSANLDGNLLRIVIHGSERTWAMEVALGDTVAGRLPGSIQLGDTIMPIYLANTDETKLSDQEKISPVTYESHRKLLAAWAKSDSFRITFNGTEDLETKPFLVESIYKTEKELAAQLPTLLDAVCKECPNNPVLMNDVDRVLYELGKTSFDPKQFKKWIKVAEDTAAGFGPKLGHSMRIRIGTTLVNVKGAEDFALAYAQNLENNLSDKDPPETQVHVLKVLHAALNKATRTKEADNMAARINKLEAILDEKYAPQLPTLDPEKFSGRFGKSKRVVVLEMFTNSETDYCATAQLAFDALAKSYQQTELALIQYHLHHNGMPDPLANIESRARQRKYSKTLQDVIFLPGVVCSGNKLVKLPYAGNSAERLKLEFDRLRKAVNPILEQLEEAQLTVTATRNENRVHLRAQVKELRHPDRHKLLRFVLLEDGVRYPGSSGLRVHQQVFRCFPGGIDGFPLAEKEASVTVNIGGLRTNLLDYLDGHHRMFQIATPERPMSLKTLRVIALLQDDSTGEILQAAQVDVP